jgi:hypothetical protein
MVNLWDVPDMNVGDMVNGYTYVFYNIMFLIRHTLLMRLSLIRRIMYIRIYP